MHGDMGRDRINPFIAPWVQSRVGQHWHTVNLRDYSQAVVSRV